MQSLDSVSSSDALEPTIDYASGSQAFIFRPVSPDDIMDVVNQWVGSYRRSKWAGTIPNNVFKPIQGEAIRQLIRRGAKVTLAVNPERIKQMLGFIVTEVTRKDEPVVHYLFVKDIYRRRGISKALLEHAGIKQDGSVFYTHKTAFSKYYRGKYVPEIARRKEA